MAVLALILFMVWVLLAGVGRSWWQRRRTGDAGFRLTAGQAGSRQWWANRAAGLGGVAVGVAAPLADLAGLPTLELVDEPGLRWWWIAVAGVGIVATTVAQLAMGASWRIGVDPAERTALVTHGPFRLVRNPIFTAAMITFVGLALAVPNLVAILGLALTFVGVEFQVRQVEEPYLQATHGVAYREYAARTGRFLPGLGRLDQPGD